MRLTFDTYNEIRKLDTLKPSRYQRNQHPPEQIERLAKLMRESGVRHPIHLHAEHDEIAFGHGRLEAARLNGWTEYPVVYQSFASDMEYYQCVQSDNAIAGWAELDLESINRDLGSFGDKFDIDLLGLKSFKIEESALPDLPDGERNPLRQVAFQVTEEQEVALKRALEVAKGMGEFGDTGNSNSNGNAITRIAETFITQHGLSEAD